MEAKRRETALREQSIVIDVSATAQKLENVSSDFLKIKTPTRMQGYLI